MPARPLCFVLMPWGRRPAGRGGVVDFDAVYDDVVAPAITDAGFDGVRTAPGAPRRDQMVLCDAAVVDVTGGDAGIFYEFGRRDAIHPYTTVALHAAGSGLAVDLDPVRALEYGVDGDGRPVEAPAARQALRERLDAARAAQREDSALELVDGFIPSDIARLKTDIFRDRVRYSSETKRRLAEARDDSVAAVHTVEAGLGSVDTASLAEVIDVLLSYRALGTDDAWQAMVDLVERMSAPLAATAMVQEQLGLALNRLGRRQEAEQVLTDLIAKRGPSSETCSLLGRVYKDQWSDAVDAGDDAVARRYLGRAIASYLSGFEADWRDAFPGINAVTLMELQDPPDPRRLELIPVVRYATCRRIAAGRADYWDHATLIQLAVLARQPADAAAALDAALAAVREPWEPESTADNLAMIREMREARGEADAWALEIEDALRARA